MFTSKGFNSLVISHIEFPQMADPFPFNISVSLHHLSPILSHLHNKLLSFFKKT